MFSQDRLSSWSQLDLQHLLVAYRKAKADCYFERSQCDAQEFATFEKDLGPNLSFILGELKKGNIGSLLSASIGASADRDLNSFQNRARSKSDIAALFEQTDTGDDPALDRVMSGPRSTRELVAKKLERRRKEKGANGHAYFSRPERALSHLKSVYDLVPEFRIIGRFSVLGHVLSALWINLAGHRFDAVLGDDVYGSRVRRYRPEPGSLPGTKGAYHVDAPSTFAPYFGPYQRWRADGFAAIKRELEVKKPVIALTLDLSNYYHRIDPGFLCQTGFLEPAGVQLNEFELGFTQELVVALTEWSTKVTTDLAALRAEEANTMGGIPIGIACTRVIANVLLARLDSEIKRELAPLYYGRYVDDVFLVMSDTWPTTTAPSPEDVFKFIAKRVDCMKYHDDKVRIEFGEAYAAKSDLCFQAKKQKMFFLDGQAGLDLLESIQNHISNVASERRLMPDPDELEASRAAQVLTAAGDVAEEADSLRRADGLSVRRLGWSIQLHKVETLARDLKPDDWQKQRREFYDFARDHVIRPDRFLDHVDYLPRLISLAVSLHDWTDARRLYEVAQESIDAVANEPKCRVNGVDVTACEQVFDQLRERIRRVSAEAVLRAIPIKKSEMSSLSEAALGVLASLELSWEQSKVQRIAIDLRESDLARVPYIRHVQVDAREPRSRRDAEDVVEAAFPTKQLADLKVFLDKRPDAGQEASSRLCSDVRNSKVIESLLPYLCPTRPYSTSSIALHDPRCVFDENASFIWARAVRAVRGVWVKPHLASDPIPAASLEQHSVSEPKIEEEGVEGTDKQRIEEARPVKKARAPVVMVGRSRFPKVVLGITSLKTLNKSWSASAGAKEDLALDRYKRVQEIVNQAVDAKPRITHLLLPELALPVRWLESVSARLQMSGISLITGLDYHHVDKYCLYSEAALVLSDDRLGFPSTIQVRQPKGVPARGEEEDLARLFEKTWRSDLSDLPKPIYSHRGFDFGVLVCSELQNIRHRSSFQGQVDCLMVLSWNRDVETFSALVESAALDVHAFIALVNNREYGDSRVRSPGKQAYRRDLCRLQGGENDFLAVVELDTKSLRAFQSRAKAWARPDDPFKPVPEGFEIARRRREVPK